MLTTYSNAMIGRNMMEYIPELDEKFPIACYEFNHIPRNEPWHWHGEFEASIVLRGKVQLLLEGDEYTIGPGEGFFLNSGVMHSVLGQKEDWWIRTFVFSPSIIGGKEGSIFWEKYVQPLLDCRSFPGIVLQPDISWQADLLCLEKDIFEICNKEITDFEIAVREALTKILALLLRNASIKKDNYPSLEQTTVERTKEMLLFIWRHYQQPLCLRDIAASAIISPNECMQCFHKTIGISPMQYVKDYRLKRAAQLL